MAVSIATIKAVSPIEGDADREMCHLSNTLYLVNRRLSSEDAICDASLAVVAMTAQYERHKGRHTQGLVHLNGLHRMVEMRDGIGKILSENIVLGQKLIR